jgi:hypothetical protein
LEIDMRIEAAITQGLGWASGRSLADGAPGTVVLQKPLIRRYFPEIMGCHDGTINLLLDSPLQVRLPDIVTPPLDWNSVEFPDGERFGFTEVEFELGEVSHRAWLYLPEYSPHRFNSRIAEVMTQKLDGIALGVRCAIRVKRASRMLVI